MKKTIRILLIAAISTIMVASVAGCSAGLDLDYVADVPADPDTITVMSQNVRCKLPSEKWNKRVQLLSLGVHQNSVDLLGTQEVVMPGQLRSLASEIGDDYGYIAYGRDANNSGEACVIFYKKARFELLSEGVFWLSETPDKVSRYSGAACNRTCAYAKLKDKVTGKILVYYNTHLDHVSDEARVYGQGVIFNHMQTAWDDVDNFILTGDFNYYEGTECYDNAKEVVNDAKYLAVNSDSGKTYHAYKGGIEGAPIDFCYLSKNITDVESYKIIRIEQNGIYASDHYGICIRLKLPNIEE